MLFRLKEVVAGRFGLPDADEAVVTRVEAGTKAVLYFFFERGRAEPLFVFKVASDPRHNEALRSESSNLVRVREMLPEGLRKGVPSVEDDGEWIGLYYFAQRYIRGEMLGETIDDVPRAGFPDQAEAIRTAWRWLHGFQEATADGARVIGSFGFERLIGIYREAYAPGDEENGLLRGLESALAGSAGTEIGLAACHGDFFPGNIIMAGGGVRVIDWRFLRRSYHRFFDLVTLLSTFYASRSGVTDHDDHEGHFRILLFERHWANDLFAGIAREFARGNDADAETFALMVGLTLIEMSVREYSTGGAVTDADRVWRTRLLYYLRHEEDFVVRAER